jgi:uncharacterized protein
MHQEIMAYDKAIELTKVDEYDKSEVAKLLLEADSCGDGRATYALSSWYLHGIYFEKNLKKATEFLRKAVNLQIPEAFHDLGFSYEAGIGVRKNVNKAYRLYLIGTILGDKDSMYKLSLMHKTGSGTFKDLQISRLLEKNSR